MAGFILVQRERVRGAVCLLATFITVTDRGRAIHVCAADCVDVQTTKLDRYWRYQPWILLGIRPERKSVDMHIDIIPNIS